MQRNIFFTCLFFYLMILIGCGQKPSDGKLNSLLEKKSGTIIQNFFGEMKTGKYQIAISSLLDNNEFISQEDSSTIFLLRKFNYINSVSGKFIDYRLIRSKDIGTDVGVYSYLAKYEKKFYRFLFVFYNNGNSVRLFEFSFDDSVTEELKESVKLYF